MTAKKMMIEKQGAERKEQRGRISPAVVLLCAMLSALCPLGCGYTLHGRASLPFNEIQIGKIENRTLEPKLQDKLSRALTEEFLKQGITVSPDAGYKISGTIHRFELRLLSEKEDIAKEYEVIIRGNFTLVDPSGNAREYKDIGSPFIVSFSGPDLLNELRASKEIASERAIRDLAGEIVAALMYL
jgi:hypothetical protein